MIAPVRNDSVSGQCFYVSPYVSVQVELFQVRQALPYLNSHVVSSAPPEQPEFLVLDAGTVGLASPWVVPGRVQLLPESSHTVELPHASVQTHVHAPLELEFSVLDTQR